MYKVSSSVWSTSLFSEGEWKTRHRTTYKLPLSSEARQIMKVKLKEEYQFYNFLQKRFDHVMEYIREERNKHESWQQFS